jgi:hypothetical protein
MVATTNIAPASTHRTPSRFASGALIAGGLLMVTMYALQIVHGLNTGEMMSPENVLARPLLYLSGLTFTLGLIGIALGLGGVGLALRQRSPRLAAIGAALPLLAALAPALNVLLGLGIIGSRTFIGPINAISVLANLAGAAVLGIAVLRTKALPRPVGVTLLAVGLATFPLILLTIPAEALLPGYVAMDLPFPGWGAIFAGLGVALGRLRSAE